MRNKLVNLARTLRKNQTLHEDKLWYWLRNKRFADLKFRRQYPIGKYIVDFYAPKAKLVIEIDGSQHLEPPQAAKDRERDEYLGKLGLTVLRINGRQVLKETDAAVELIYQTITTQTTQLTE